MKGTKLNKMLNNKGFFECSIYFRAFKKSLFFHIKNNSMVEGVRGQ